MVVVPMAMVVAMIVIVVVMRMTAAMVVATMLMDPAFVTHAPRIVVMLMVVPVIVGGMTRVVRAVRVGR
jgi:hypothetical protein